MNNYKATYEFYKYTDNQLDQNLVGSTSIIIQATDFFAAEDIARKFINPDRSGFDNILVNVSGVYL